MWQTLDDTLEADKIVSEILFNMQQELVVPGGAFNVVQQWASSGLKCDTATLSHLELSCHRFVRHLDQGVLIARQQMYAAQRDGIGFYSTPKNIITQRFLRAIQGFVQGFADFRSQLSSDQGASVNRSTFMATVTEFGFMSELTPEQQQVNKVAALKIAIAETVTAIVSNYTGRGLGGVMMVVYVMSEGYVGAVAGGSIKKSYHRIVGIATGIVWPALLVSWGACGSHAWIGTGLGLWLFLCGLIYAGLVDGDETSPSCYAGLVSGYMAISQLVSYDEGVCGASGDGIDSLADAFLALLIISVVELCVFPRTAESMFIAALHNWWEEFSAVSGDVFKLYLNPQSTSLLTSSTPDYDAFSTLQSRMVKMVAAQADVRAKLSMAKSEVFVGVIRGTQFPGQAYDLYLQSLLCLSDSIQMIADAMWTAELDMLAPQLARVRLDGVALTYKEAESPELEEDVRNPLMIASTEMFVLLQHALSLIQENCAEMTNVLQQAKITPSGAESLQRLTHPDGPLRMLSALYDAILQPAVSSGVVRYPTAKLAANHALHSNLQRMAGAYECMFDAICGVGVTSESKAGATLRHSKFKSKRNKYAELPTGGKRSPSSNEIVLGHRNKQEGITRVCSYYLSEDSDTLSEDNDPHGDSDGCAPEDKVLE